MTRLRTGCLRNAPTANPARCTMRLNRRPSHVVVTNASYGNTNGSGYNTPPSMTTIDLPTQQQSASFSAPAPKAAPQKTISYRISFFDAMKINGPAPERINARLAMAMMFPAALRESQTGESLFEQIIHPDLVLVATSLLIIHATMIPILKGCKDEDFGKFFSVRNEKVNGSFAMLGWAAWIGMEYVARACFF